MSKEEIKKLFAYMDENERFLSLYQIGFIKSLKRHFKRWGSLSEKQLDCLVSLKVNMVPE
jgi:hypothetical protein